MSHKTILGIDPGTKEMGLVVLRGRELLYFGVHTLRNGTRPHDVIGQARRIVLASSFAVYDWSAARGSLNEDSPIESRPYERDGYTVAKVWQERVARRLAAENQWALTVLRPGFIYGPGAVQVAGAGVGLGKQFLVIGPMTRLPLTHVNNCAAAFADAAEKEVVGTFNIVDDEHVSAWRYAGRLLGNSGGSMRLIVPYSIGLCIAYLARLTSRILFPPNGGKLPEILVPRRYCAVFKPLRFENRRAKEALGWTCRDYFAGGCDVT